MDDWRKWLKEQRGRSEMKVREMPLKDVPAPWGMQGSGDYGRSDGQFFKYIGIEISVPKGREVASWMQPMKVEVGPGAVVLIVNENDEMLITARMEPGNPAENGFNYVLIGPTIQASKSNLDQAHGGKKPPYSELLNQIKDIAWTGLWQDGGRDFKKLNYYAIIRVRKDEITLLPDARWFTPNEIAEAITNGDTNEHLSQALALLVCKSEMENN